MELQVLPFKSLPGQLNTLNIFPAVGSLELVNQLVKQGLDMKIEDENSYLIPCCIFQGCSALKASSTTSRRFSPSPYCPPWTGWDLSMLKRGSPETPDLSFPGSKRKVSSLSKPLALIIGLCTYTMSVQPVWIIFFLRLPTYAYIFVIGCSPHPTIYFGPSYFG